MIKGYLSKLIQKIVVHVSEPVVIDSIRMQQRWVNQWFVG